MTQPPSQHSEKVTELFDVIIVGAGPGGATCAWKSAEDHGLRVLVLERAATLPRYKPCGGGIPSSLAQHVPGIAEAVADFTDVTVTRLRHSWKGKDTASAALETTSGEPAAVWMVQRPRFDGYLVERARAAGATIETGVKVADVRIDTNGVLVTGSNGETFQGKAIVGADGAKGIVGSRVGLRLQRRYGIAREMEIPFSTPDGSAWHPLLEQGARHCHRAC